MVGYYLVPATAVCANVITVCAYMSVELFEFSARVQWVVAGLVGLKITRLSNYIFHDKQHTAAITEW